MDPNFEERFNEILMHHGVKGMKWGVRRTPAQLGHKRSGSRRKKSRSSRKGEARKKRISGLVKKRTTTKTVTRRKKASEFTDDELQAAVKRLQLEKQYNDLVRSIDGQQTVSRGRKIVNDSWNKVLAPAIQEAAKEKVKKELKKKLGVDNEEEKKKKKGDS